MTANPTRNEATTDLVVAALAKSLRGCIEWIEDVAQGQLTEGDRRLLADAFRALARAGYAYGQPAEPKLCLTANEVIEKLIKAGKLQADLDPERGEVVYAMVEGEA
jgi:hypothetical protein